MLGVINEVAADVDTLLVIGHEPTTSQLALGLADADTSDQSVAEQIAMKYPTSAIAVLRTESPWEALTLRSAALVNFHVPR